jgi:hypothetical protein
LHTPDRKVQVLLFSDRSVWTMVHGLLWSGGAMMAMAAALFALTALSVPRHGNQGVIGVEVFAPRRAATALAWLAVAMAVLLWLSVLMGTYLVFPLYRATPPEGALLLHAYPRALLLSSPETRWLHAFGMEVKEHMPWIAAMLTTAVAFIAVRYRTTLLMADSSLRRPTVILLAMAFAIVAFVALLGVFVNKVAPLE